MMKISKVYPRDIIAFFVLMFALFLIYLGINAIVSGIVIMIVTYYFTQRAEEEMHPEKDLGNRIKKVEENVKETKEETKELKQRFPKPLPPGHVIIKPTVTS